jgi:hypothetical protein
MKAIDKFILHVVHNLFPLNEYSQGILNTIMQHYRDEADDLNISITDDQLKKYIERFDRIKSGIIKKGGTDLVKIGAGGKAEVIVSLSKLIRIITSSKGAEEAPEEADITPDVVYNQDGLIIYNGSKEDNCLNYGRGESWCITRGSFGNYRYDTNRKNPTFYLVKDNNLSDSDRKSFFVVVVGSDNTYKASDRSNNDVGGRATEWDRWEPWSFVEQNFPSITGLKNVFKYIPLSSSEKLNQSYKNNPTSIRDFIKFPYSVKEQYLVVRKGKELFTDISTDQFVEKYLSKYPQLASFISTNYGIIPSEILVKHLDKFSNQDTRSIIANMRDKIKSSLLSSETIPFEVKKFLVKFDKWSLDPSERLYVTKDGNAIVKLIMEEDIKLGVYTEEDDYPNVKLNKRTSKYLLDYPELDKIPLNNLLKLSKDEIIDKNLITKVLDQAKEDPNSAIIVKETENGDIILDSNSFSSYKIGTDGKITSIPFDNEEVQQAFASARDNKGFQQNALNIFKTERDIPVTIDKKALVDVVNSIPYNQRVVTPTNSSNPRSVVVLTSTDENMSLFTMYVNPTMASEYIRPATAYSARGTITSGYDRFTDEVASSYFTYLRQANKSFDDNELKGILSNSSNNISTKKAFVRNNPPVNADNVFKAVIDDNGDVYLINTQNTRESFMLSTARNNLRGASISTPTARQLLGQALPAPAAGAAQPAAGGDVAGPRRGRPAGVPNAPRPQQPAAPAAAGNQNVGAFMQAAGIMNGFMDLPRPILRRLNVNDARGVSVANNRGASRRQNILGDAGRVISSLEVGPSTIYLIRLPNGSSIASVVIQPGNNHYLITSQSAYQLESPSQLLSALQQRNLAEIHQYLVNEYMERNPKHLTEFKELLRKHINEKKK